MDELRNVWSSSYSKIHQLHTKTHKTKIDIDVHVAHYLRPPNIKELNRID